MRFLLRVGLLLAILPALLVGSTFAASPGSETVAISRPLLSPIFGDHMVLQRGKLNPFWGWTTPGQSVRVRVADKSAETAAGPDGVWKLAVEVPEAGGPYTVVVDGPEQVTLNDVMVGDVWLCSGQSNMAMSLRGTLDGPEVAFAANLPSVRLFRVVNRVAYAPVETLEGNWQVCSPDTAGGFSAVAFYFARKLHAELGVPIGLIQSAVGGSPAESWIGAEALAKAGEFQTQVKLLSDLHAKQAQEHGSFLMHWLDEHDVGGKGEAWAKPEFDDSAWRTAPVPGGFAELGVPREPAIAWFRREITLPDPLPTGNASIHLGIVERMDTVYVNGTWTGASSWVENPRAYTIPATALKPGRNVIAIRVFKTKPSGGFMSPVASLRVQLGDGREVPLAGEWKAAVSYDARPPATLPLDLENYPTMPTVLYNGMIAPFAPLAITGAIWYQGEANTNRPAEQYLKLMPALIGDWRAKFEQGEFPFYIVGLPAFQPRRTEPSSTTDGWTALREVQAETVRRVRNTGLAVTIDTGEADDIHPKEKQPVGARLALAALAGHYRKPGVAIGPTLRFVERRPGGLVLHFDHADGGLKVKGDRLGEFSIRGADGVWHWANARIEGADTVVVSADAVREPLAARYAWQSNPQATLFNAADLPAVPFRTDD
ncbi:MAG TPA: sialate O-acetylesterase [Opitutus sp.]|nr:sialate O-acetylesterase [Opitutus sp.]